MEKKKLSKKIKIAIIVTVVLLFIVGAAVFGVFFLKGGTAESFDYTSKETMYEDDVSSYTESISDTYGNTICYNPENAFIAIKKAMFLHCFYYDAVVGVAEIDTVKFVLLLADSIGVFTIFTTKVITAVLPGWIVTVAGLLVIVK